MIPASRATVRATIAGNAPQPPALAFLRAGRVRARPAAPRRMLRCKEYLDENVCDTALRVSDLAAMCGVSEVYFRREFKRFYGTSPLEYIKKRRIEIACQLLSTGLYNVTQVAERAGFDSVSYFSAEFRRLTGQTPSQYQSRV